PLAIPTPFPTRRSSDLAAFARVLTRGTAALAAAYRVPHGSLCRRPDARMGRVSGGHLLARIAFRLAGRRGHRSRRAHHLPRAGRAEEHTSELQSPYDLV